MEGYLSPTYNKCHSTFVSDILHTIDTCTFHEGVHDAHLVIKPECVNKL